MKRMNHVPGPPPNDPYRGRTGQVTFGGLGPGARWAYVGLVALTCLGFFGAVGLLTAAAIGADGGAPDDTLLGAGMITFVITMLLFYALIFVGLYWLYKAWDWLPNEQRYTKNWRGWISPAQASLFLLIPYFHYYWMFVVNCGLCDALDRMRVTYPTREAAPKTLAIAACICQLVVPLPVGAIMWLVFMSKIERMTREMASASLPQMPHAV